MTGTPLVFPKINYSTPLSDLSFPRPKLQPFQDISNTNLSFPKIEDPFADNSPLPQKRTFFSDRINDTKDSPFKYNDQFDTPMTDFSSENEERPRKSPKLSFPLQPLVVKTNSLASIDSYFSCPQGSEKQPEVVIPTKKQNSVSDLPLNALALIDSKPSLSWKAVETAVQTSRAPSKSSVSPPSTFPPTHKVFDFKVSTPSSSSSSSVTPVFKNHDDYRKLTPEITTPVPASRRPRIGVRRIHSMFGNPKDVLGQGLNKITENPISGSLPTTPCIERASILEKPDCPIKTHTVNEDQFKRIDSDTLCEILDGSYKDLYDRYMIIDCRFEYEYEGGHIEGALNINTKERLEELLLSENVKDEQVLLVFHCEYSAHRGPRMARHLRNLDRQRNINRYPFLNYPDVAILSGGYSQFFSQYGKRCFPQKYVEMNDMLHRQTCERELGRFKRDMRFSRSQSMRSNLFGSSTQGLDGSPIVNAPKSFSCLEFASISQTPKVPPTPTCRPIRKLGVKLMR